MVVYDVVMCVVCGYRQPPGQCYFFRNPLMRLYSTKVTRPLMPALIALKPTMNGMNGMSASLGMPMNIGGMTRLAGIMMRIMARMPHSRQQPADRQQGPDRPEDRLLRKPGLKEPWCSTVREHREEFLFPRRYVREIWRRP